MKDWLRILGLASGLGLLGMDTAAAGRAYWCDDGKGKRVQQSAFHECNGKHWYVEESGGVVWLSPPQPRPLGSAASQPSVINRQAERQDLDLIAKYPHEASHHKARAGDLDVVRRKLRSIESRLAELAAERKRLDEEAEFYTGKPLPPVLQRRIDENAAKVAALLVLKSHEEQSTKYLNDKYDIELARLTKLWGGAAPGSLGFLPLPPPPSSAKTARSSAP